MDKYLRPGETFKRLLKEYQEHGSLWVGCDFDSTIHDYHKEGESYSDIKQLLRDLKSIGCKIIIWTAYKDLVFVKQYCEDNNLPCDGINTDGIPLPWYSRKPFFSVLIDDRAGLPSVYEDLTQLIKTIKQN